MAEKQTNVDINKASLQELTTVKGIGESLGQLIIENRPYLALRDLVKVPGISDNKLDTLMPYLTVEISPGQDVQSYQPKVAKMPSESTPMTTIGDTEAFVFLEDRNERQDALLILFGGFILGLLLLMLRRSSR